MRYRLASSSRAIPPGKERGRMSEIKLKPCPFCREEANMKKGFGGMTFFECTNKDCGAIISFREYVKGKTQEQRWNRRADNETD